MFQALTVWCRTRWVDLPIWPSIGTQVHCLRGSRYHRYPHESAKLMLWVKSRRFPIGFEYSKRKLIGQLVPLLKPYSNGQSRWHRYRHDRRWMDRQQIGKAVLIFSWTKNTLSKLNPNGSTLPLKRATISQAQSRLSRRNGPQSWESQNFHPKRILWWTIR